jgi:hypothetical protein
MEIIRPVGVLVNVQGVPIWEKLMKVKLSKRFQCRFFGDCLAGWAKSHTK